MPKVKTPTRNTRILSISVSPKEEKAISRLAKKEGRSKSELVREAIRRFQLEKNWEEIKKIGEKLAVKMGIEKDEDVERIAG